MRAEIRRGVPVVVMESSCLAVVRHEMPRILSRSEDAKRLQQNCYGIGMTALAVLGTVKLAWR